MNIETLLVDYNNQSHAKLLVELLNGYALDPMGGGQALDQATQNNLAANLAKVPGAFSIIVSLNGKPSGLANCFMGFSTFKSKPLVNIHDLVVLPADRGKGLSQRLLAEIEKIAIERGCCKVTLEVLEKNNPAKVAYLKYGFDGYELDPVLGKALFWQKVLD